MNMYRDTGVCATPLSQPLLHPTSVYPFIMATLLWAIQPPPVSPCPKWGFELGLLSGLLAGHFHENRCLRMARAVIRMTSTARMGLHVEVRPGLPQRGTRRRWLPWIRSNEGSRHTTEVSDVWIRSTPTALQQRDNIEWTRWNRGRRPFVSGIWQYLFHQCTGTVWAKLLWHAQPVSTGATKDQRSTAPAKLGELLGASLEGLTSHAFLSTPRPDDHPENRVRKKSGGTESSLGTSSLFRKLRKLQPGRNRDSTRWIGWHTTPRDIVFQTLGMCAEFLAHFDAQSVLFDLHEAAARRSYAAQRRNTATGASAASSAALSLAVSRAIALGGVEPSFSSTDDLSVRDLSEGSTPALEHSEQGGSASVNANSQHQLLLSCPHFINETGSYRERNVSFLSSWAERGEACIVEARLRPRCSNASVSKLEVPPWGSSHQARETAATLHRARWPGCQILPWALLWGKVGHLWFVYR